MENPESSLVMVEPFMMEISKSSTDFYLTSQPLDERERTVVGHVMKNLYHPVVISFKEEPPRGDKPGRVIFKNSWPHGSKGLPPYPLFYQGILIDMSEQKD